MPNYRRNFVPGGCYFYSQCAGMQKEFIDHIDLLRDSVRTVRLLYPFHIDACCRATPLSSGSVLS